jgi:hypothetical protein
MPKAPVPVSKKQKAVLLRLLGGGIRLDNNVSSSDHKTLRELFELRLVRRKSAADVFTTFVITNAGKRAVVEPVEDTVTLVLTRGEYNALCIQLELGVFLASTRDRRDTHRKGGFEWKSLDERARAIEGLQRKLGENAR